MVSNTTIALDKKNEPLIRSLLESEGFVFSPMQYAFWRATSSYANVTFYSSGKLLIQGKESETIINLLTENKLITNTNDEIDATHWIGTDEAGKGDYFGPLVVASVMCYAHDIKELISMGVKDSKNLTDQKIIPLAKSIKQHCVHSIVCISPEKYNNLITKMKNLNHLLAWGHAKAIENILEKHECFHAISDQFGNKSLIENALQKHGKNITLIQRHKAESNIAVACASILARATFLYQLKELSQQFNIPLPKGATHVIPTGKKFVTMHGAEKLSLVAKTHFKTTQKIV